MGTRNIFRKCLHPPDEQVRPFGREERAQPHNCARENWSGRRDSNPQRPAWKAGGLPLTYSRVPNAELAMHSAFSFFVAIRPEPFDSLRSLRTLCLTGLPFVLKPPSIVRPCPLPTKQVRAGGARTTTQSRKSKWWARRESNPRRHKPTGLQPVPFGRLGTCPLSLPRAHRPHPWSWRSDSNRQPPVYKTGALPLSYASLY